MHTNNHEQPHQLQTPPSNQKAPTTRSPPNNQPPARTKQNHPSEPKQIARNRKQNKLIRRARTTIIKRTTEDEGRAPRTEREHHETKQRKTKQPPWKTRTHRKNTPPAPARGEGDAMPWLQPHHQTLRLHREVKVWMKGRVAADLDFTLERGSAKLCYCLGMR